MMFGMTNPLLNERRFRPERDDEMRAGWGAPGTAVGQPATAPPAGPGTFDRIMTVGGTLRATAVLWGLILASGWFGWSQVTPREEVVGTDPVSGQQITEPIIEFPPWLFLGLIVGLAMVLISAFKPKLTPYLSPIYAISFGAVLGGISAVYELAFDGIVFQAVLATMAVFGVMLFLYASRIIKVTRRFAMVVVGATFGIFAMYLLGFVAQFFGADIRFWNEPSPLGIGISVVICIVAALNLAMNFAFIETASRRGMPKYMDWVGALGMTVTIVWLYLEMLRLLALLRQ